VEKWISDTHCTTVLSRPNGQVGYRPKGYINYPVHKIKLRRVELLIMTRHLTATVCHCAVAQSGKVKLYTSSSPEQVILELWGVTCHMG